MGLKPIHQSRYVLLGRWLLASIFILAGLAKLASTEVVTAGHLASEGLPLDRMPTLLIGGFELIVGFCLGLGVRLRWTAPALAISTIITSLLFHQFWAVAPEFQFAQQLLFMKNIGLAGGLLLAAGASANITRT
ncbi:DoxX family protein [Roseateles oligotrophus]|uniref:DoxX family protein n=1 Tax=Roseateles oligotrophus TaxID=1769250 RepID=A0ABT2YH91_9BURK|nr:DoxX family protein [Roseateles oligotrophus]MCV2369361.1 DoxX family protein [Roseateles oligotrophus]